MSVDMTQDEMAKLLEARSLALKEIAEARYWKTLELQRLNRRADAIARGNNELRRRIKRLPVEAPPITFYSITDGARELEEAA